MMKIKGAIFDCDGTLVDSLGFWEVFYKKIGDTFFGGKKFIPDPEDDKAMRTQAITFLGRVLHDKYGLGEDRQAIMDWTLDVFGWYYEEVVELKNGVREFLEHLKAKGVRICIASAAEVKFIKLVLSKHGILDYFESIISCSDVGVGKDQPDVFFAAEKFLGTPHEETWVFEDSVLAIETAKKADFHVVGVYDPLTFGQDRSKELSDEYIDNGGSFVELIEKIK